MSDPLFSVEDQIVLVSGGSRGIGKELARAFAQRDAQVIIASREQKVLEEAARELSTGKYPVKTVVCDVAQTDSIAHMTEVVKRDFGRVDTLLNVAGVNKRKRVETYSEEEFDFILDINLKGAFFVAQSIGKLMITQKSGVIVNIDSLNSYAPLKGVLPYAMSKGGISMMTRGMAMEWGEHGVRVNAIAPGFILTDLTKKLWSDPTMQAWGFANTPLRRLGEVEDLVGTALFLAGKGAAFLTGQVIYVDGGFCAGKMWPIPLD